MAVVNSVRLASVFALYLVALVAAQSLDSCPRVPVAKPKSQATCTKDPFATFTFRNAQRSAGPVRVYMIQPNRQLGNPRTLQPGQSVTFNNICPGFQYYLEAAECDKCIRIHYVTVKGKTTQGIFVRPDFCDSSPGEPSSKPNIILLMADDIGSRDFGFHGGEIIKTPVLDDLAKKSLNFLSAWATPLCRTTRAIVMTGKLPFETKWFSHKTPPPDKYKPFGPGIGNLAKSAGYSTLMVGKWQIFGRARGQGGYGFDNYTIWRHSDTLSIQQLTAMYDGRVPRDDRDWGRYQHPMLARDDEFVDTDPTDFSTNIFLDDVQKFMRNARSNGKRSFIYWPMTLAHKDWDFVKDEIGWVPMPILRGNTNEVIGFQKGTPSYKMAVEYMDKMIGLLIDGLKRDNFYQNTIVIFCTDNGSPSSEESRGFKAWTNDERGVRVPVLIHGGGGRVKARATRDMFSLVDLHSTIAGFMGQQDNRRDSLDFSKFALGQTNVGPRKWSFSFLNDKRMLRTKDWIFDGRKDLYNCKNTTVVEDCVLNPPASQEVTAVKNKFNAILQKLERDGTADATKF